MADMFTQDFIFAALKVSIILGLLLSFLGVHVVGRGIVFVDLALGQISMLGVAVGGYFGSDETLISIAFTLVGAFLLSFIKVRDRRLKQEAIIGIIYAVASAATVLFISKSPHGDSDISEVLFGSVFTVTNEQISTIAIVFGLIGLVHLVFRKKFFELTEKFENHQTEGIGIFNPWNFLFYLSIGLSIVLAVKVAGVIPVFSYLIIPAVSAAMLTRKTSLLVMFSIVISILGGFFGLFFSTHYDFPAGSSVVAMLGFIFAVASIVKWIRNIFDKKVVTENETELDT